MSTLDSHDSVLFTAFQNIDCVIQGQVIRFYQRFLISTSKLHNAYDASKAGEDNVFTALDHEGKSISHIPRLTSGNISLFK